MRNNTKEITYNNAPKEIERKFLVKDLPDRLDSYNNDAIRQGYLVLGKDGSEARLRDRNNSYFIAVKSSGDLSRNEWEVPITREQFDALWPATEGKRIEKTRFYIPISDDNTIELDIYSGKLLGLITAEVEFSDEEKAMAFKVPVWFGTDITSIKTMKNQYLAENGLPDKLFK